LSNWSGQITCQQQRGIGGIGGIGGAAPSNGDRGSGSGNKKGGQRGRPFYLHEP
jgi:hypothetical protein